MWVRLTADVFHNGPRRKGEVVEITDKQFNADFMEKVNSGEAKRAAAEVAAPKVHTPIAKEPDTMAGMARANAAKQRTLLKVEPGHAIPAPPDAANAVN